MPQYARLPSRWFISRLGGPALFLLAFTVFLPFFFFGRRSVLEVGPALGVSPRIECRRPNLVQSPSHNYPGVGSDCVDADAGNLSSRAMRLRVPGFLVQLAALVHRYIHLLIADLAALRVALRVRGYRNRPSMHSYRTIGHVAGILLVRGVERADRVSQAMRCRGFDGRYRSLATFQTGRQDVLALSVTVVFVLAVVYCDVMLRRRFDDAIR